MIFGKAMSSDRGESRRKLPYHCGGMVDDFPGFQLRFICGMLFRPSLKGTTMKSMLIIAATLGLLSTAGNVAAAPSPTDAGSCAAAGAAATQHAICRSPALAKVDVAMNSALEALLAASTPADAQVFRDSQKYWLDDRDADCDAADDSGKPAKPAALEACVRAEDLDRTRFLLGGPAEGPGTGSNVIPVMREGQGFIWSFRFSDPKTPGETLVDQKLDATVAGLHIGKIGDDSDYTDSFNADLKYASPVFLSASVDGEHVSPGGTNNQQFDYNLNVDMQSGKLLTTGDAFAPTTVAKLQKQCAGERRDYLKLIAGESAADRAADQKKLNDLVADLSQWSFGATAALVNLDPGDEDPYICHFPYKTLRPLLLPGFPLP
jgi:uncharacterized protein YecT (DUF1311 family)